MGSKWNFTNFASDPARAMNRAQVSIPLSREEPIYSWTLDQFQNNLGKEYGLMKMDEFINNIVSVEETQVMVSTNGVKEELQRQGSITLPPILCQKTVDEVWKYITEEEEEEHTTNNEVRRTNIPQIHRQHTSRDNHNNGGNIPHPFSSISGNRNTNLSFEFQQKPDLVNNGIVPMSSNQVYPNVNSFMSTYQPQQQQNQLQPQQPHGYGYNCCYGTQNAFSSGNINTNEIRGGFMGIGDQSLQEENKALVPSVAAISGGTMSIGTSSPITPFPVLDGIQKSNSQRDRKKSNVIAAEKKGVEKTQRRKLKNRESAARSRARKQAQTMELEAELEKLKKENQELLRKQANDMINRPERRLRRTKSDIN